MKGRDENCEFFIARLIDLCCLANNLVTTNYEIKSLA